MFEGRAVEAAGNFQPGATVKRTQAAQAIFEAAHIGDAKRAQIENGSGTFGDYVGARAAFDDSGVYGDAAAKIVPFFDARKLMGQFMDGVDAFLRREAGVRCAAVDGEFGLADSFARSFQEAAGTEGGFEDEDGVATARFGFKELARGFAADLFVGGPEEDEAFAQGRSCFLQCLQGVERLNDSCLHVENSGTVSFAAGDAEGHGLKRAAGINGVVVTQDQELACGASLVRPIRNAEMIGALLLRNAFDAHASFAPFFLDDFATKVGNGFFEARGFGLHEPSQGGKHLWQARLQEAQEFFG